MKQSIWVAGLVLWLAGCSGGAPLPVMAQVADEQLPELSQVGYSNCMMIGGFQAVSRQLDGSLYGVCALPNGKRCNELALSRGNCD